jgi:DNA-binding GntR family transcriptional regulator
MARSSAGLKLIRVQETRLADQAADQIRRAIHAGKYLPGTRLVERRLAGELGISHIPVREALARLAEEGLVERLPRRGARVAGLTLEELEELTSLRIVLEQFVVERVQQHLSSDAEAGLRKIVDAMVKAASRGDALRVFDLDRDFHARLWGLTQHSILIDVLAQLRGRLDVLLREATVRRPPSELKKHARAHVELLKAILSRDPKLAKDEMVAHIQDAAERLRPLLPATSTD